MTMVVQATEFERHFQAKSYEEEYFQWRLFLAAEISRTSM